MRTIALLALTLAACGNADHGIEKKNQSLSTATAITLAATNPSLTLGPCKNLTVYAGTDPSFASTLQGTSACAGTNLTNVVRLRVSANFPVNARVCLVPFNTVSSYPETCFLINGQADITVTTPAYTGVSLVREGDLQSYFSYLNNPAAGGYPPFAYAVLR